MSHLNNNNMIPSHEQFVAYVKGKLSGKDKDSFEMAMESDAFLAEALEGYQKNPDWIGSITNKVNANIQTKYPTSGAGGSAKYFYLAAAALLVVILTVVFVNIPEKSTEPLVEDQRGVSETNPSEENENVVAPLGHNDEEIEDNVVPQEDVIKENNVNDDIEIIENDPEIINNNNQDDYKDEEIILNNFNKKKNDGQDDNNLGKNLGSKRLAVEQLAIALKENPARDGKTKTKIKEGQVITIDKTKNNKNYKQEDLPSFYGGDDALKAEIHGAIKSVHVQKLDGQYDRVIGFDFEVAANGKVDVKSLKFKGNPYPEMKVQIIKAVNNLPYFRPGKASGSKGRIRYGFMMKY